MEPVPGVDEDLEDAKPGHHAPVAPVATTPTVPADPAVAVGEEPASRGSGGCRDAGSGSPARHMSEEPTPVDHPSRWT